MLRLADFHLSEKEDEITRLQPDVLRSKWRHTQIKNQNNMCAAIDSTWRQKQVTETQYLSNISAGEHIIFADIVNLSGSLLFEENSLFSVIPYSPWDTSEYVLSIYSDFFVMNRLTQEIALVVWIEIFTV